MATLIVQDAEQTYLVDMVPGETLVVGRAPECDLPVTAERASRKHAEIRPSGEGHVVVDLGSTNGTQLNGTAFQGERPLADGDEIDVGGSTLVYRVRPSV